MKLIAGLGNPGPKYERTRHNVGFWLVDALASRWRIDVSRFARDYQGLLGDGVFGDERVLLLKPQTYMNLSGRSVAPLMRFYKLAPSDALVAMDDLDLPPGRIRLRARGSAGGQRGLESVLQSLGTQDIPRLRIGIGRDRGEAVSRVLGRFAPDEREPIEDALQRAVDAVECWLAEGLEKAMSKFNSK